MPAASVISMNKYTMEGGDASNITKSAGSDYDNDMISARVLDTLQQVIGVYIFGFLAFLGTVFNVINIVVFVKLGFSHTTNISLLALAVADIGVSFPILGYSFVSLPSVSSLLGPSMTAAINSVEGNAQVMFSRISGLLKAYMALERLVCVAWPLRVKTVITPTLTISVTTGVFVLMTIFNIPFSLSEKIGPKFDPVLNLTFYGLPDLSDDYAKNITITVQLVAQMTSFTVVTLSTLGLIRSLRQSFQWRKSASSAGRRSHDSGKEKQLVKIVILISTVFIACSLPTVVGNLAMVFVNDFSIRGRYRNLFLLICLIFTAFNCINSMINIFVYANMSSRFREKLVFIFKKVWRTFNDRGFNGLSDGVKSQIKG